ncbi:uncharacterized, partial [Tachysurus ichikawai]
PSSPSFNCFLQPSTTGTLSSHCSTPPSSTLHQRVPGATAGQQLCPHHAGAPPRGPNLPQLIPSKSPDNHRNTVKNLSLNKK